MLREWAAAFALVAVLILVAYCAKEHGCGSGARKFFRFRTPNAAPHELKVQTRLDRHATNRDVPKND